jgi:hypothetical protein
VAPSSALGSGFESESSTFSPEAAGKEEEEKGPFGAEGSVGI